MDNLTHSLAGWAIGQAGLKTKSRKGLAALILGANAPDIDVFFGWFPWEPLATHRGFTHSLIGGVIILPLVLWWLLRLLDAWQVRRGTVFKSGLEMHPGWLLALCYIGALTHPLLDLQTTYSVQLFSPISGRWFHSDSLFIIDWVVWLALILGIARSQGREAAHQRDPGFPSQIALLGVFAYICFNLGLTDTATRALRHRYPEVRSVFASPPPFAFWNRSMVWREGTGFGHADWSFTRGLGPDKPLIPGDLDDPIVARAARDSSLTDFFHWSTMTTASVTRRGCRATVSFGDARYLDLGARRTFTRDVTVRTC